MEKKLLESIKLPQGVKNLDKQQLEQLCFELREEILDKVSVTGGHLASNLGAVELTVALHYVFDSPREPIVWDVGHQCYSHKLLTGRDITGIRTEGGVSGFPKPCESEHDAFVAGQALRFPLPSALRRQKSCVAIIPPLLRSSATAQPPAE